MMHPYDVCVIGTGRVGLPLALSFVEAGLRVVGVDVDADLRAQINAGQMPFCEPGYEALIAQRSLQVHETMAPVAESGAVVITVGTPLHTHIETDLRQIRSVLEGLAPWLRPGQLICLRSTVAPGTTRFAARFLERASGLKIGEDLGLAFCPERIAEGKAYEELRSLAQIIGAEDALSSERASALFSVLSPQIFTCDWVSAELVKLFNNIARYVHFALANQFALIADTFDANIYEIRELANYRYPRAQIAAPGFTAGTCLRKDFGMINEWSPYPDMLLSAWKMNEFIPAFLVRHLMRRAEIHGRRVAVLGYTFKKDTDDTRDSLAPKLCRYIERELPEEIRISDHHLPVQIVEDGEAHRNWPIEEALRGAEVIFVATNHTGYDRALRAAAASGGAAWVADIWNVTGINKVFYQLAQLTDEPPGGEN